MILLLLLLSLARTHAPTLVGRSKHTRETLGGGDEPEGPFTAIVAASFVVVVGVHRVQTATAAAYDALSTD